MKQWHGNTYLILLSIKIKWQILSSHLEIACQTKRFGFRKGQRSERSPRPITPRYQIVRIFTVLPIKYRPSCFSWFSPESYSKHQSIKFVCISSFVFISLFFFRLEKFETRTTNSMTCWLQANCGVAELLYKTASNVVLTLLMSICCHLHRWMTSTVECSLVLHRIVWICFSCFYSRLSYFLCLLAFGCRTRLIKIFVLFHNDVHAVATFLRWIAAVAGNAKVWCWTTFAWISHQILFLWQKVIFPFP